LKTSPQGAFRRPRALQAPSLLGGHPEREMDRLADRRLQLLPLVLAIGHDPQSRLQRMPNRTFQVSHLGHPVADDSEGCLEGPRAGLMAVPDESLREGSQGILLQCHEHRRQDGPHDRVPVALEPAKKAVERKPSFWYFVGDGDLDFEVVHWATPPRTFVGIEVGCSPFFISWSIAIT